MALLADVGYDAWFFQGRRLRPIREFEPALQSAPRSPGYVNNSLFRPRAEAP